MFGVPQSGPSHTPPWPTVGSQPLPDARIYQYFTSSPQQQLSTPNHNRGATYNPSKPRVPLGQSRFSLVLMNSKPAPSSFRLGLKNVASTPADQNRQGEQHPMSQQLLLQHPLL